MMKKVSYLYGVLLVILIGCNVVAYFQNKRYQRECRFLLEYNRKLGTQIELLSVSQDCRLHEMLLNGKSLKEDLKVQDMLGETFGLRELCESPSLIMRYSKLNCGVCVDSLLSVLERYRQLKNINSILLLTTSEDMGYVKRFRAAHNIDFPIYIG